MTEGNQRVTVSQSEEQLQVQGFTNQIEPNQIFQNRYVAEDMQCYVVLEVRAFYYSTARIQMLGQISLPTVSYLTLLSPSLSSACFDFTLSTSKSKPSISKDFGDFISRDIIINLDPDATFL